MKKFLYLISAVLLISCAAGKNSNQENGEVLYARAMNNFKLNRIKSAIEDFEELETTYDFEKYHEAMVMVAYAHYSTGNYDDSLLKIDSIRRFNMGTENLQYVYYLEILAKYKKIDQSKRDLTLLKELFYNINDMLALFPGSIYENDIIEKERAVLNYIVESELNIVAFYLDNNNLIGALNHLREVIDNYPENIHSPQVSYLMYEIYSHIGYPEGRDLYLRLLHERYKNSKWFEKINS
ncbi:MAG: outer membrane protein assembly factor BamD [Rickettsiales bacterium]|jgi:outer membrane assembly lipoprotein YfiO|nr:outer membrane protein assembly factor BamD [Rickettsiales bacterium]